jgi:hypothetical protein
MDKITKNIHFLERRMKPRINCDYPAIVQGCDSAGKRYKGNARVINLSTGGIYMMFDRSIQKGGTLSVRIALPTGSLQWGISRLATKGNVIRSEFQSDGNYGIAVQFQDYKFL